MIERSVSALTYSLVMAAFGSVVLPNRRTGGRLSFHSPAASRFLGPQVDDHLGPVSLRVYVFRGDACNPSDIDANLVRNRAVVMTGNRACSFTQRFANFASKGAAAVLGIQRPRRKSCVRR